MPGDHRDAEATRSDAAGWYIDFDGDAALDLEALKARAVAGRRKERTAAPPPPGAARGAGPWLGDLLDPSTSGAATSPVGPPLADPSPPPRTAPGSPPKRGRAARGATPVAARSRNPDPRSSEAGPTEPPGQRPGTFPVEPSSAAPGDARCPEVGMPAAAKFGPSHVEGTSPSVDRKRAGSPPGSRRSGRRPDHARPRGRALGASVLAAGLMCGVLIAAKVQLSLRGGEAGTEASYRAAPAVADGRDRGERPALAAAPAAPDIRDAGAVRWTEPPVPAAAAPPVETVVADPQGVVGTIGPGRTIAAAGPPGPVSGLAPDRAARPRAPAVTARTVPPFEAKPLTAAPVVLARTEPTLEPMETVAVADPAPVVPPDRAARTPSQRISHPLGPVDGAHRQPARAARRTPRAIVRAKPPPAAVVGRTRPVRTAARAGIGHAVAAAPARTARPVAVPSRTVARAEGVGEIALPASLRPTPF